MHNSSHQAIANYWLLQIYIYKSKLYFDHPTALNHRANAVIEDSNYERLDL